MGRDPENQPVDKINELKEEIRRLKEENLILNKIIFKAPIPIFVLDRDHKITHFNQALEELAGLDGSLMLGCTVFGYLFLNHVLQNAVIGRKI